MNEKQLRAIHAQACAAVARIDRTAAPADERFWPLYLAAVLAASGAVQAPKEKIAPVQGYSAGIPWSLHLEAYDAYSKRWSAQPALLDLEGRNCRGGFSTGELDQLIPGWRDRMSELDQLIPGWRDRMSEIGRLNQRVAELEAQLVAHSTKQCVSEAERDVLNERRRQVEVKGFTAERDDMYDPGFLASAAAAYLLYAANALHPLAQGSAGYWAEPPTDWPFDRSWWKPESPRTALKKGTALALAEMDRIDRDPGDESIHHHTNGGDL